jgi:hypothetical protein
VRIIIDDDTESEVTDKLGQEISNLTTKKTLPIGIDSFEKLRKNNCYYVDKTGLLEDLLRRNNEVTLFTRPRRFGKTLNMSMLKAFFEIGTDKSLFDGLKISKNVDACNNHMGRYPVIFLSLKNVDGLTFESACKSLKTLIWNEARRFSFLKTSEALDKEDKAKYMSLTELSSEGNSAMNMSLLEESLQLLSKLLSKHYGSSTVILIDEYDVPLDKAHQSGYYKEMASLIRNLLGNALKTNDSLAFAILTGCLRISKESIFTGLNNLAVYTVKDRMFSEFFGFTDSEVSAMLEYYGITDYKTIAKEWYDGYKFGDTYVYCPWDVINFCDDVVNDNYYLPKNYWINTSGNALIRSFIDLADNATRKALEALVAGEPVVKKVNETLTYEELYDTIDNLWSVMYTTGYLTVEDYLPDGSLKLKIPNKEVRELYVSQIQEWFKTKVNSDKPRILSFTKAIINGDEPLVEDMLNTYLRQTISIRDTAVNIRKENFYHGILLGLLSADQSLSVKSNLEAGYGYADICVIDLNNLTAAIIEIKYTNITSFEEEVILKEMNDSCKEALNQIEEKSYQEAFAEYGVKSIVKYGIAFYKKRCLVKKLK